MDPKAFKHYLRTGETAAEDSAHLHHKDTLEEHDKKYHGGLYDGGRCLFRSLGDESDELFLGAERHNPLPLGAAPSAIQSEYDAVVAKYSGTKQWMKAPNGKQTNLTERQWVQVRTPSFKKWFGDWELQYLHRLAESVWRGDKTLEKFAFSPSGSLVRELKSQIGLDISQVVITADSIRHLKKHHGDVIAEASRGQIALTPDDVVLIPYLLNNFDYAKRVAEKDDKFGKSVELYKRINGISAVATISRGDKKQFVVTSWKLMPTVSMQKIAPTLKPNALSDVDIDIVQKDIAQIKAAVNESSKVVDENGEPLVVYHGTKDRFDVFTGGDDNNSSWFAENIGYAKEYAGNPEDGNVDAWVKRCFLRVRNPFDMREGENAVDGYAEISSTRHDGGEASEAEISKIARLLGTTSDDIRKRFNNRQIWEITQSREFAERLRSLGYDGIKFVEVGEPTWATFDPVQVKSATDNSGAFSPSNESTLDQAPMTPSTKYLRAVEDMKSSGQDIWR